MILLCLVPWSIASGDIKYLVCHVTSLNHVIEESGNFMGRSSSWFVAIGLVVVEI